MKQTYLALAIAAIGYMNVAHAAEADIQKVEKIEVTGSNIKRINKETASPVQIISREEIARTGATTLAQLVDTLAASTGALDDIGGSSSFASGASGASLRNMGKDSTLVLLNGRRVSHFALADGAQQNFVNLDALPTEAVERVEILKDGASAIYGSDAVAGVINVITRKNFRGLQAKGSYEKSQTSKLFSEQSASITGGIGNLASDGFNVLANLDLFRRDSVMFRETLEFADKEGLRRNPSVGTKSTYAGNIFTSSGVVKLAGCPGAEVAGALCRYDQWARIESIPKAERANFFSSAEFKLGEGLSAFGDLGFSNAKTTYKNTPPAYGVLLGTSEWPGADGNIKVFTPRGLPAGHPLNPDSEEVQFRYRFSDAESMLRQTTETDQVRVLGGLKGVMGEWDWEAAVGHVSAKTTSKERGSYSVSGFKEVIGDYDIDDPSFFNKAYKIGQQNSYEVLNKLFPQYATTGKTSQTFVDGKVSGSLMEMEHGPLAVAAGFDLRTEKFEVRESDIIAVQADIVNRGATNVDGSRTYGAVFTEFNIPLTKALEAEVAARIDKFPTFNAHVSPKLGLRYVVSPSFLVRGTFAGGFRAPNLPESSNASRRSFAPDLYDPKRCDAATAVYTSLQADADALDATNPTEAANLRSKAETVYNDSCNFSLANTTESNKDLKPETSRSQTIGFVFEPNKSFNVAVDFWGIERKNEITTVPAQEVLLQESKYKVVRASALSALDIEMNARYAGLADHQITDPKLTAMFNKYKNISKTKTRGFDVDMQGKVGLGTAGKLNLGLEATYLANYRSWSTERQAYGNNLAGTYDSPRLKANISGNWEYGGFDTGLRVRFTDGYSLVGDYTDTTFNAAGCAKLGWAANQCRVSSKTTLDASLGYKGVKNLNLLMNVENLLNRKDPTDLRKWRVDSTDTFDGARGRMVKLSAGYKFF